MFRGETVRKCWTDVRDVCSNKCGPGTAWPRKERMSITLDTPEERAALARTGVTIPSGQVARTARWVYNYGPHDALVDYLARGWFESRLPLVPADTSIVSGDLAARLCRSLARTAVRRAAGLAHDYEQHADSLSAAYSAVAPMCDRPTLAETLARPTDRQVMHASANPMGAHGWSLALEHAGTALLAHAGLPSTRPDVWVRAKRTHVTRPDSVAFRGTARYQRPAPCRYGKSGLQAAIEYRPDWQFAVSAAGEVSVVAGPWSIAEHLTALARRDTPDNGTRYGFRGHRLITWQASTRMSQARKTERAAARLARPAASATRGPKVGPWSMTERAARRAVDARNLTALVGSIESAIRLANGPDVTFADGTSVRIDGPSQVIDTTGRAFPVREYARRLALATGGTSSTSS